MGGKGFDGGKFEGVKFIKRAKIQSQSKGVAVWGGRLGWVESPRSATAGAAGAAGRSKARRRGGHGLAASLPPGYLVGWSVVLPVKVLHSIDHQWLLLDRRALGTFCSPSCHSVPVH